MSLSQCKFRNGALKLWVKNPKPSTSYDCYDIQRSKDRLSTTPVAPNKGRRKGSPIQSTHFLLRGGQWDIPDDENDNFLWHYAINILQNEDCSVVEKRTAPYFRYHLDFDFNDTSRIDLNSFKKYVEVVQEVLHVFYPHSENMFFECTVSMASYKDIAPKSIGSPNLVKSGFHVIFHNIWVDADKALAIRSHLIVLLRNRFGNREVAFVNDWEDIVDESIYVKNGLRMIGALKYHACKCGFRNSGKKAVPSPFPNMSAKEEIRTLALSTSSLNTSTDTPITPSTNENVCNECDKGYVFEGRPYYLVAAWDHKCETITRLVPVPRVIDGNVPCFTKSHLDYVHPEWAVPFDMEKPEGLVMNCKNPFWAMPMPRFFTQTMKEEAEEDDELLNYQQLGKMDTFEKTEQVMRHKNSSLSGVSVGESDITYEYIPFHELIVFGNPLDPENQKKFADKPWDLARLFHNVLRICSLRVPPELSKEFQAIEEEYRADPKKLYMIDKRCRRFALFVKPPLAVRYSVTYNLRFQRRPNVFLKVPYARHDAVLERLKKEDGRPHKTKRRIEGLNEFKKINGASGKKLKQDKIYLEDEKLMDEIQDYIRKNVGISIKEPKEPYANIDVIGVYYNACKSGKPNIYYVQVAGIGASFCANKGGDHNSNGIFFSIDSKGIYQRCFCTCAEFESRATKAPCKDFKSVPVPLSKSLKRQLFSKIKQTQTQKFMEKMDKHNEKMAKLDDCTSQVKLPEEPAPVPFNAPDELDEYQEFLKRKRAREEQEGLEDPTKRKMNKV